ncbi:MAG: hypothetical protein ABI823_17880 [Bryobacteraceae bacterium]
MLEGVVVPLMVFGYIRVVDLTGFDTKASVVHGRLVDALERGPVEAQQVMEENLRKSLDNYLAHSL